MSCMAKATSMRCLICCEDVTHYVMCRYKKFLWFEVYGLIGSKTILNTDIQEQADHSSVVDHYATSVGSQQ